MTPIDKTNENCLGYRHRRRRCPKFHVDVETAGKLTRGMTVVDQRIRTADAPTANVVIEVEAQRFTAEFMESLLW